MEYFKANIYEIKKSGSLRILGALVALFHLTQFYLWWDSGNTPLTFYQEETPICWPVFQSCGLMRLIPFGALSIMYFAYAAMMGIAAMVFLFTEFVAIGYFFLSIGFLLSVTVYFQDYRLSSNEGYFTLLATIAYLYLPAKHRLMRWLFASFFIAIGLSLTSPAWLAGTWFQQRLGVPIKLGEWFAALSVLVSMIGGISLLFRDGRYFWSGWSTLFLLCGLQLYTGELFGASMGMGWLLYVAFDELELRKAEREYLYQSFIRPEPSFLWGGFILSIFWLAQIMAWASVSNSSRLRTYIETWSVAPKVSHRECETRVFARFKQRIEEVEFRPQLSSSPQLACNPYITFLDLRNLCRKMKDQNGNFLALSASMTTYDLQSKMTYRSFEVRDICRTELKFSQASGDRWITNLDM